MENPIRLLIVDDHPALRFGLAELFRHISDFCVVGEAGSGEEAVELADTASPDVILMDLSLPKMSGLEAIQEILAVHPEIRILIFSAFSNGEQILAGLKAGAIGYLVKNSPTHKIISAVRDTFHGKPSLNSQVEIDLIHEIQHHQPADFPVDKLTDREIEILSWMGLGLTNTQIAQKGGISEGTVRSHVSHLLNKLGLENRSQAVIYTIRKGLINLDP